jgi:hypothetical protein
VRDPWVSGYISMLQRNSSTSVSMSHICSIIVTSLAVVVGPDGEQVLA